MFIAMNRFHVAPGREEDFESLWRNRDSYLDGVPGFQEFHLLRGGEVEGGGTLYSSHTIWATRQAFEDWTNSEAFKQAHADARAPKGTYLSHPRLEGFDVILTL